jgi:hypothetical protein
MSNFVFTCPSTSLSVQHCRDDDDEDVPDNEYEAVMCKACARLHLINRKTGKVLGQVDEPSPSTDKEAAKSYPPRGRSAE